MHSLNELEIGAMFWAGKDPEVTLKELISIGFRCGQIGIPGDLDLSCARAWRNAAQRLDFRIYTVFAAFTGESYADIPAVKDTVGFVPARTREERKARMLAVSDFAATVEVPGIATHVGFVPEDVNDHDYLAVREVVRNISDHAQEHRQTFALETGQERAELLLSFIFDVNRENLGINFDPANMILYGTGDPIEAVSVLAAHILTVHAKDGDWPPPGKPGALGTEKPLGKGSVDFVKFIQSLRHAGYRGPLAIEREGTDEAERIRDLQAGAKVLRSALDATAGKISRPS